LSSLIDQMSVQKLRIRIPPLKYEEEVGDEFMTFGDLCAYIKPYEACGTCFVEGDDACSLCLALHSKKPECKNRILLNECLWHFDHWFRALLLRKRNILKNGF